MEFRIYVENLAQYNAGKMSGVWLDLPRTDLEEELAKIGVYEDNEYIITDYENDFGFEVWEHEDIHALNELAERLDNMDVSERDWLMAYCDETGEDVSEAIEHYEERSLWYNQMSLEEVAEELVNDCYDLPEFARRYFDYDAYAQDLHYDGYVEYDDGVLYVY